MMESPVPIRLVVGLFHSSGIAEDAVHRLITEGIAPRDIARRVLKEVSPVPPVLQPELAALDVDPLVVGGTGRARQRCSEALPADRDRTRAARAAKIALH
jgi:hypothetical protein